MDYFCINFCILYCELISRELYLWDSFMPWLRLGVFRVLHFFCQMLQGYCQPGTTSCVQFLGWGFSDHIVVQFKSQISLQKGLWLHILEEILFLLSIQSFLIVTVCQLANFFLVSSLWGSTLYIGAQFQFSASGVGSRAINSPFPGQLERLDFIYYSFLVPPQHIWPLGSSLLSCKLRWIIKRILL